MDGKVLARNLTQLCADLQDYATKNSLPAPSAARAKTAGLISADIPLSNGTGADRFAEIVDRGSLLCLNRLVTEGLRTIDSTHPPVEQTLGTADSVFLFAAPFRFPSSECGFLFSRSLEEAESTTGTATPFDSGGLVKVFQRSDPAESPIDFLHRHELPIPEHRELLRESMKLLFDDPWHYIEGVEPHWPGPIGLQGGDQRRWTHEVRIHEELSVRHHLEAVFVAKSRANDPRIQKFLEYCQQGNVYYDMFEAPRSGEFTILKDRCLKYIRTKLTG